MNTAQRLMLFGLWNTWRKALRRQGVPAKDCDQRRREVTKKALGYDRSWREGEKWSNAEVDALKAALLALTQADDMRPQLESLDQPRRRMLYAIDQECGKLRKNRDYARGIAKHMSQERKLPSGDLEELEPKHLTKILVALKLQVKRAKSAKPARASQAIQEMVEAGAEDPDWSV